MREIKFRAWDKNRKTFHYWGLNSKKDGAYFTSPPCDGLIHEQFTGLLDKNGKDIYEGDIVICTLADTIRKGFLKYKGVIEYWHDSDFCFGIKWGEEYSERFPLSKIKGHVFGFDSIPHNNYHIGVSPEVIGNIYENPELLENNK